ncbi:cyclin-like protein [Papiliotrema laurentii]|uniref:Cyclin-like protein n=1 Tax=Papiliotrema laurentii TaxID=5418 RepID=A0AAD9FWM2_PAPLA|nr:cyclin-like protein [Papiliotrema laurentii]
MTASTSKVHIKQYRPYFSPAEVEKLSAKQRGKLSVSREERARQQACGFIDATGVRCGFPRRTIATAQSLYMRFHLFFPYKDFNYVEVALSALYVSSKLHDTLKKPRDIILASYAVRYPQLIKKGVVDPSAVDANMLEGERTRVLGIERLVLETMCFKFGVDVGLDLVVKIGRALGADKELCQHAWRVAVDCHRSPAPLSFPPHIIALTSLYTASILSLESTAPHSADTAASPSSEDAPSRSEYRRLVDQLGKTGSWEQTFHATWEQIDDVTHLLLDLYLTILSTLPADSSGSFSSPSAISPKEASQAPTSALSSSTYGTAFKLPPSWTTLTLTELKIHLRDRRPGLNVVPGWNDEGADEAVDSIADGMGQNDGTVRFLWGEPTPVATSS